MKHSSARLFSSIVIFTALSVFPPVLQAGQEEEAYTLNQEAMVDMSTAKFDAAAQKFIKAAGLVSDYQIKDKPLRYTPNFMAAWAFEKTGNMAEACRYYGRFLEIAPPEEWEPTKAEHAQEFLDRHCGP